MMATYVRVPYGFGPTQTILDECSAHPNEETHECMAAEYKCVYCGAALKPYNCNGCGEFLSPAQMHDGEVRCRKCE
jgi:DNA-directed RNA polymerase subunit RPC12/RpoP